MRIDHNINKLEIGQIFGGKKSKYLETIEHNPKFINEEMVKEVKKDLN